VDIISCNVSLPFQSLLYFFTSQRILCSPYPLPPFYLFMFTSSPQFLIPSTPHVPFSSLVPCTSSIPTRSCHTSPRRFSFQDYLTLFLVPSLEFFSLSPALITLTCPAIAFTNDKEIWIFHRSLYCWLQSRLLSVFLDISDQRESYRNTSPEYIAHTMAVIL